MHIIQTSQHVSFVRCSCAALYVAMTPASCQRDELWLLACDGCLHRVVMQVSGAYADMGMTEWLFIISADRSNSPAGLPGSQSQFLSLFAMDSVAMIMNTNLSSDCVRLCLSLLLKIPEALCQSSTVSWNVSNRIFKNCFCVRTV